MQKIEDVKIAYNEPPPTMLDYTIETYNKYKPIMINTAHVATPIIIKSVRDTAKYTEIVVKTATKYTIRAIYNTSYFIMNTLPLLAIDQELSNTESNTYDELHNV